MGPAWLASSLCFHPALAPLGNLGSGDHPAAVLGRGKFFFPDPLVEDRHGHPAVGREGLETEEEHVWEPGAECFLLTTLVAFSRTIKSASGISIAVGHDWSTRPRLFARPTTIVQFLGQGYEWSNG